MLGLLHAPRRTFAQLAERDDCARIGLLSALSMGACWSGLLALLAADGHAPSGPPLLPIAPQDYYAWEAAFVIPVRLAMFAVLALVVQHLGRRLGGTGDRRQSMMVAGVSLAAPSIFLWLIPDIVVYVTVGFEALGPAMRVYALLSAVWTLVLVVAGVRAIHGLSMGRALLVAFVGLLAHTFVGGPFLR